MGKRLLLLSNSTIPGEEYLGWPREHIRDFLGKQVKRVLFVPYAGVTISFDDYSRNVSQALATIGYEIVSIHNIVVPDQGFTDFDAIVVGGGNTFQLAATLQSKKLMKSMKEAAENGKPFIGWSAGANIACPTIRTTNDMPITEPESFSGLGLVPFQINPHYTEAVLPNHGGETRMMRIKEFLVANPSETVIGLPERSLLRYESGTLYFMGKGQGKIFRADREPEECKDGDNMSFLLQT